MVRTQKWSYTDTAYDSVAYDLGKSALLESQAEAEEPTNHNDRYRALWLVYSSASASDSDNRKKCKRSDSSDSDSVELLTAYDSNFLFSLGRKRSYDSDYDSDYGSVASENQPLCNISRTDP